MTWIVNSPALGQPDITAHQTAGYATPWKLGDIVKASHPTFGEGEFIYLKGVVGTVVGSWVTYHPDDWSTALIVPSAKGAVAVAMSACVANEYGWYQINGKATGKAADVADSAAVYIDTVAGTCDDAVVVGDRVKGAWWASADATATGTAEVELHRPYVDDMKDAT